METLWEVLAHLYLQLVQDFYGYGYLDHLGLLEDFLELLHHP